MVSIVKKLTFFALTFLFSITLFSVSGSKVNAAINTRPSGMFVKDQQGKYYYVYYLPGTNYSTPRLKYIGQPEILDYYLKRGLKVYNISNSELTNYTIHDHNLGLPCGEAIRDNNGRIAFFEPLGWPPGAQDQADPVFSFAENFPYYVGYVDWNASQRSSLHYQNILREYGYNQVSSFTNILDGGIYPFGIPNCVIVKQTGSNDYYRVFRHRTPDSKEIERKMKIPTPEILGLWQNFNSYSYMDVDITSLPNVGNVKIPPGLLIRTINNESVYFTDDEGNKIFIPTIEKFVELGFNLGDIKYVNQSTLDSAATKSIY